MLLPQNLVSKLLPFFSSWPSHQKRNSLQGREPYSQSGKFPLYTWMDTLLLRVPQYLLLIKLCCWPVCTVCVNLSATNHAKTQEMMKNTKKICEKALVYLPPPNQLPRFSLWLLEEIHDIFFEKCIPLKTKRSWRPCCLPIVFGGRIMENIVITTSAHASDELQLGFRPGHSTDTELI